MRKLTLGKIVKNGVTYSGSSDNANNVKYNNNASNLDATNVQEAIDKLDESVDTLNSSLVDNLTWKLLSTVSGNTQVSLPDNFYEINAIVKFRANNNIEFGYVYNFAKIQLEDNDRVYCQGFGFNNANNYCQINASKSSISVKGVVQENTSYISTAQLQVYYR